MRIKLLGRLSIIVIRPSPAFLFPAQAEIAPVPAGGPSNVYLQAGSIFAHGDHASHLRKSLMCGKILSGGATMPVDRVTQNSFGCMATMTRNRTTMIATVIRMMCNTDFCWLSVCLKF